jgi:hypothetical protein
MGRGNVITGLAIIAAFLTGFFAFVGSIFAFSGDDWTGMGLCLIAAGLSFGAIANAILRR